MNDTAVRIPCPYCKELIIRGAIKCRHCQSEIKGGAMLPTEYAVAQALSEPLPVLRQTKPAEFHFIFRSTVAAIAKTFQFTGRSSRSEFWFFLFACTLVNVAVVKIGIGSIASGRTFRFIDLIFNFMVALPQLSVSVRRLHDTGRRGLWILIAVTIIGFVPLIYWWSRPSQPERNRFGDVPDGANREATRNSEQAVGKVGSAVKKLVALSVIGLVAVAGLTAFGSLGQSSSCQSVAEVIADQFTRNLEAGRADAREVLQSTEGKEILEALSMTNTPAALELMLDPTKPVVITRAKYEATAVQRTGIQTQCAVRGILKIRFAPKDKSVEERDFAFTSAFTFSDRDGLSIIGLDQINVDAQNLLLKHLMFERSGR